MVAKQVLSERRSDLILWFLFREASSKLWRAEGRTGIPKGFEQNIYGGLNS